MGAIMTAKTRAGAILGGIALILIIAFHPTAHAMNSTANPRLTQWNQTVHTLTPPPYLGVEAPNWCQEDMSCWTGSIHDSRTLGAIFIAWWTIQHGYFDCYHKTGKYYEPACIRLVSPR